MCEHGLVVTSSYSGTGGFEVAAVQVLEECARLLGMPPPSIICYSATEVNPAARKALMSHGPRSRPMHIFTDILDRLPGGVLEHLKGVEARRLQLWVDTKNEHKDGNLSTDELLKWHEEISSDFLHELHTELAQKHTFAASLKAT